MPTSLNSSLYFTKLNSACSVPPFLQHYAPNGVQRRAPGRPAFVRVALQEVDHRVPHRLRLSVRPCRAGPTVTAASACRAPVPPQGPDGASAHGRGFTCQEASQQAAWESVSSRDTRPQGAPPRTHTRTHTRGVETEATGTRPSIPSSEAGRLPSLWAPGGSWGGSLTKIHWGALVMCTLLKLFFPEKFT